MLGWVCGGESGGGRGSGAYIYSREIHPALQHHHPHNRCRTYKTNSSARYDYFTEYLLSNFEQICIWVNFTMEIFVI